MYRTQVTQPIPTEVTKDQNSWYMKPGQSFGRYQEDSPIAEFRKLEPHLSMQPLEIVAGPYFTETRESHLKISVIAPDRASSDDVPALISHSSQETDESSSSWGTTEISCADGKKVSLYNVAQTRLRVQKDSTNSSCENASHLAQSPQSRPMLNRSVSEISHIPVIGGDTVYESESDFEVYEMGIARFQIPVDHRTHSGIVECDRRVSDARSEALEKYRGKLNTRLDGIMSDFDSKIDSLIVAAKHDFASLRRDYTRKTSFRSRSRRRRM